MEDKQALVFASDLGIGEVQLKDSRWARRYVSVDEREPQIRQMIDILQVGDIVRVNPSQVGSASASPTWQLTQLQIFRCTDCHGPERRGARCSRWL